MPEAAGHRELLTRSASGTASSYALEVEVGRVFLFQGEFEYHEVLHDAVHIADAAFEHGDLLEPGGLGGLDGGHLPTINQLEHQSFETEIYAELY